MQIIRNLGQSALSPKSIAVQEMFDRIAPRYDLMNRLLSARQDVRWRQLMVAKLPLPSHLEGGRLLDLACGTGDVLLEAMRSRPDYRRFVGLDLSSQMLAVASRRLDEIKVHLDPRASMELVHGTATALPFDDGEFDGVSISFGLRNVDDRLLALKEMGRVLRKDGKVLILEFFPIEGSLWGHLFEFYFRRILPLIGGLLSDRKAYRYLPESVNSMPSFNDFQVMLSMAGLRLESANSWLFGGCRLIVASKAGKVNDSAGA